VRCPLPASKIRSQLSNKPIGKLPTSPRNKRATGRLKGANPIIAPHRAIATSAALSGSAPIKPKSARAAVTGITSATVIQSIPSMKLTRFTNQSPPSSIRMRSNHQGSCDTMRRSAGNAAIMTATATVCSKSLGEASSGRMSSVTPIAASPIVHAKIRESCEGSCNRSGANKAVPATEAIVAAITAIPAPCGVGSR